jgi:very-short-patch-repair endonuclease
MAYPGIKLLIEVQGGIWIKSGHSTGTGITRDCEKNNFAVQHGWRVLYFTGDMVKSGEALQVIEKELKKSD